MPQQWTCTIVDATNTQCTVTAYSTSSEAVGTSTGQYNGASYQEWLFVAGILLFFVSYMTWGRIFRPIKEAFYDN